MIYLSWAPHCDHTPYNSWVMGYNETTLKQVSVLNLTPNGSAGSVSNDLPLTISGTSISSPPMDI